MGEAHRGWANFGAEHSRRRVVVAIRSTRLALVHKTLTRGVVFRRQHPADPSAVCCLEAELEAFIGPPRESDLALAVQ
jgi:hypothetical protein